MMEADDFVLKGQWVVEPFHVGVERATQSRSKIHFSQIVVDIRVEFFPENAPHVRRRMKGRDAIVFVKQWNRTQTFAVQTICEFPCQKRGIVLLYDALKNPFSRKTGDVSKERT